MTTKLAPFALIILSLAACSTAPVQEMSDARQAIRSAGIVGAVEHAPAYLAASARLLREAQARLEAGAYDEARRLALEARRQAIKAREHAAQATPVRLTPP